MSKDDKIVDTVCAVVSKANPMSFISETIDYFKTKEYEETKRQQIRAWTDVETKRIKKSCEVINNMVDNVFKDRKHKVDAIVNIVNSRQDADPLQAMQAIVALAQINPASHITNALQKSGNTAIENNNKYLDT